MKKQIKVLITLIVTIISFMSCSNKHTTLVPVKNTEISQSLSSEDVISFEKDSYGYLWIGTSDGLNVFDGYNFVHYYNDPSSDTSIPGNKIEHIYQDHTKRIWICTDQGLCFTDGMGIFYNYKLPDNQHTIGLFEDKNQKLYFITNQSLFIYDDETKSSKKIYTYSDNSKKRLAIIPDNDSRLWLIKPTLISCVSNNGKTILQTPNDVGINNSNGLIHNNTLWVCGGNGLMKIDLKTLKKEIVFDSFAFNKYNIVPRNMVCYNSKIFMTTKNEIYSFNPKTNQLSIDKELSSKLANRLHPIINTLFADNTGDLWVGYSYGGFENLSFKSDSNNIIHQTLMNNGHENMPVLSIASRNDSIWLLYDNNRVGIYDMKRRTLKKYNGLEIEGVITKRFRHQLTSLYLLKDKIALFSNGRIILTEYRNDKWLTDHCYRFGMQGLILYAACTDKNDNLIFSTSKPLLLKMSGKTQELDSIPYPKDCGINANSQLISHSNGRVYIVSPQMKIHSINNSTNQIDSISVYKEGIPYNNLNPTCVSEGKNNEIWIGTNKGLLHLDLSNMHLSYVDHFPSMTIKSILTDSSNNLWMGTRKGMALYRTKEKATSFYPSMFETPNHLDNYCSNSACLVSDSILLFGNVHGCSIINPHNKININEPNLQINTLTVTKGKQTLGTEILDHNNNIYLDYDENDITIAFNIINMNYNPIYTCQYQIKGYDPKWMTSPMDHHISYSNLPAGDYKFMLRILENNTDSVYAQKELNIRISPAPWASIQVKLLYFVLGLSLLLYIIHLYLRNKSDKLTVQMLEKDKVREQTVNQMNLSFFANISHEFRNPLTMIMGPISTIRKEKDISTKTQNLLNITSRSINQMLRLIDQMLDFNKLETDALKMMIEKTDISEEMNEWIETFKAAAQFKGIKINTHGTEDSRFLWLDRDKLGKILSNLFSNALKHTPQNGSVDIGISILPSDEQTPQEMQKYQKLVHLYVQNSGNGIPEDQLEDIFKRYYQADNKSGLQSSSWGTGIGLYYVQRLVNLHHGIIYACNVYSKNSPVGVTFHVWIPADEEAYSQDDRLSITKKQTSLIENITPQADIVSTDDPEKPYLLIVDDDIQIAYYLKTLLSNDYNVINKYSAESALELLDQISPDLIISDVVMDKMSGYQLCQAIKQDRMFCHIPIILLTGKTQTNEQIEGLDAGANAYVTKPFDSNYLLSLIRSILKNRELFRQKLISRQSRQTDNDFKESALSPQDASFMKDLYALFDKMMVNEDINFNDVADKLLMSRRKFNYKLKGLTGETPIHFLMKYKLNKAAELLKEGKYNVSEVSYMTGFSSISHFSASFKKYYGVTPSDYK